MTQDQPPTSLSVEGRERLEKFWLAMNLARGNVIHFHDTPLLADDLRAALQTLAPVLDDLSSLPPIAQPDAWRPIETAPRDGTEILLLVDGVAHQGEWQGPKTQVGDELAELYWISVFAGMRAKDDAKTFAKVGRGALQTIADRARKALSSPPAGVEGSGSAVGSLASPGPSPTDERSSDAGEGE